MELSSFSENIITRTFTRNSVSVEVELNIDVVTPEYLNHTHQMIRQAQQEMIIKVQAEEKKAKDAKQKASGRKKAQPVSLLDMDISLEAEFSRSKRELFAEFLTHPVELSFGGQTQFLKGWDLQHNGVPVPVSKEVLLGLSPRLVEEFYMFCVEESKNATVKKKVDAETGETSENTHSGSMALRAV